MMKTITVISTPNCVQCGATKRLLDELPKRDPEQFGGLEYTPVDVTAEPSALDLVHSLGYNQAPVVIVRDEAGEIVQHWSGYRNDLLKQVGAEIAAQRVLVAA